MKGKIRGKKQIIAGVTADDKIFAGYFSLDLIPDPFIILRSDGIIYNINASCSKLIGNSGDNVAGRHYMDFAPLKTLCEKLTESIKNFREDFDLTVLEDRYFEVFVMPFKTSGNIKMVRIMFKDISGFVTLEKELLKRNRELIVINSLSSSFISSENMDMVVENLFNKILLITDFNAGWLILKEDISFRLKTSRGVSTVCKKSLEEGALDPLCEEIIKTNEPLFILEGADISKVPVLHEEGIAILTAIPLVYENNPIGFMFLAGKGKKENYPDFDFAALLSLIGNHVSLIMEKIMLFQETRRLSITDGLTGLFNSRYFYKHLDLEIARINRYGNSFSIIMFDIDNFKQLNDSYGHQAGDDVLHELAKLLVAASRETDIVARYGGEEFVIILPNTSEEDTINLADRIRESVGKNIFLGDHSDGVHITLSGGIASYPQNAYNSRSLLNAADIALYKAKTSGKNRILCYQGKLNEKNIH